MCGRLPRFTISSLTVHRFLIASVCVSTKALCDAFCTNSHYAKIGGIKLAELNVLEREFLSSLEWRLIVSFCNSLSLAVIWARTPDVLGPLNLVFYRVETCTVQP